MQLATFVFYLQLVILAWPQLISKLIQSGNCCLNSNWPRLFCTLYRCFCLAYIQLASYTLVKIVTPCFNRPSLLSSQVPSGIVYWIQYCQLQLQLNIAILTLLHVYFAMSSYIASSSYTCMVIMVDIYIYIYIQLYTVQTWKDLLG